MFALPPPSPFYMHSDHLHGMHFFFMDLSDHVHWLAPVTFSCWVHKKEQVLLAVAFSVMHTNFNKSDIKTES